VSHVEDNGAVTPRKFCGNEDRLLSDGLCHDHAVEKDPERSLLSVHTFTVRRLGKIGQGGQSRRESDHRTAEHKSHPRPIVWLRDRR
jgi:hypothetical protein